MRPATVEILITKGNFEPAVPMAVSEALDMTIQNAQMVTVPILQARFAAAEASVSARFAEVNVRLVELRGEIDLLDERMKRRELRYILCTAAIVFGNSHLGEAMSFIADILGRLPN